MKKSLQRIPNILLTLEDLLDLAIPQIQTLLKIIKYSTTYSSSVVTTNGNNVINTVNKVINRKSKN